MTSKFYVIFPTLNPDVSVSRHLPGGRTRKSRVPQRQTFKETWSKRTPSKYRPRWRISAHCCAKWIPKAIKGS
jgi:hypothetical protein